MIIVFAIVFILSVGLIGLCVRELRINFYNPIPKFENGDKRIGDINILKTRNIRRYTETERN